MMTTIILPARFDLDAVRHFLEDNDLAAAPVGGGPLVIDNEALGWIEPVGLVMLLAITRCLRGSMDCGDVRFTRVSSDHFAYLQRMNLLRELGIERPEGFRRHPSGGRFDELRSVSDGRQINPFVNDLIQVLPRNEDLRALTHYYLTELLDNAFQHADPPQPPVTCAQKWAFSECVQIAVADCGIGIRRSLSQNPEFAPADDAEAIDLALRPWTTGTGGVVGGMYEGRQNMGMGLYMIRELTRRAGGTLLVVSGSGYHYAGPGGPRTRSGAPWPGTLVAIEWPMNVPDSFEELKRAVLASAGQRPRGGQRPRRPR
jgi:hypothetical protein